MEKFSKYLIKDTATIKEALDALNNLSSDTLTLFVINKSQIMVGALTDGDIRRWLVSGGRLEDAVVKAMEKDFHYIQTKIDVREIKRLRENQIKLVPYLDSNGKITAVYDLKRKKSILPIDAVLMAGGKGERLRPLTEKTPKPLLPVGEKTIIDYNIERLLLYGVEHISVTVNYLREQIEAHFEKKRENIQIQCVREPKYLGTIGSVKFIETFHNDTLLIMNSDLFTNIDYEDFYLHFLKYDADMSVAAIPYSISVPYGIFELDNHYIQGIKEKPVYNYYANAGIYLIKKSLIEFIPDNTYCDATDLINLLISIGKSIIRYPLVGYWVDIGKHEDYKKVWDLVKHIDFT